MRSARDSGAPYAVSMLALCAGWFGRIADERLPEGWIDNVLCLLFLALAIKLGDAIADRIDEAGQP